MAATVNFGTVDPDLGIYGIYNDFLCIIEHSGGTVFKLKYRIKVSDLSTGSAVELYTKDVETINEVANVNPVEQLRSTYFKTQIIGSENGVSLDDTSTDDVADKAYNQIRIEVGEIYASSATTPATFQGYDTSDDFFFYNGYETIENSGQTVTSDVDYTNYRDDNWYIATTIKLPIVNLNQYVERASSPSTPFKLMFPNTIRLAAGINPAGTYDIESITTTPYDLDGVAGTPTTTNISTDLTDQGYWSYFVANGLNNSQSKIEVFLTYDDGSANEVNSQTISLLPEECNKNELYRVRYYNRYGAFEYLNFIGKKTEELRISGGKKIATTGVDYTTTTFANLKPTTSPEIISYGDTAEKYITLYTGYLTETQQEQVQDLMKSRNTILYLPTVANTILPVVPEKNSYQVERIEDGLQQISIRFRIAVMQPIQIQ